jgi:hypothetical protein
MGSIHRVLKSSSKVHHSFVSDGIRERDGAGSKPYEQSGIKESEAQRSAISLQSRRTDQLSLVGGVALTLSFPIISRS